MEVPTSSALKLTHFQMRVPELGTRPTPANLVTGVSVRRRGQ